MSIAVGEKKKGTTQKKISSKEIDILKKKQKRNVENLSDWNKEYSGKKQQLTKQKRQFHGWSGMVDRQS